MPYIDPIYRSRIDEIVDELFEVSYTEGDLNYTITKMCHKFALQFPKTTRGYSILNAVVGVLECAKQEFVRVVLGPYEDKKRIENGSVSELDN